MTDATDRDAGYDHWLDALEDGDGYYLECPDGHGSLPPRRVCPDCGSTDLAERALPETGTLETYTIMHVATPQLAEDTPYVTAIAEFDAVHLTGMLRGVDHDDLDVGLRVEPTIETTETTENRVLVFRRA